jgi:hypothetical protein
LKLDRKHEPLVVDLNLIDDHRDEELSYHNERYFITLYPGLSRVVEHMFLPHSRDGVPLEAGHEYRIDFDPAYSASHTRWDYERKWQVLKWRIYPFRRKTYALEENRNHPRPVEIRCVENRHVRSRALMRVVSCCLHFL